jgi:hypothetical protein
MQVRPVLGKHLKRGMTVRLRARGNARLAQLLSDPEGNEGHRRATLDVGGMHTELPVYEEREYEVLDAPDAPPDDTP